MYYTVANHRFCVEAPEDILAQLCNYDPFRTDLTDDALFSLTVTDGGPIQYIEELSQDEERLRVGDRRSGMGQEIICGHTEQGDAVFEFRFGGRTAGWLVCSAGYREGIPIRSGLTSDPSISLAMELRSVWRSSIIQMPTSSPI